MPKRCVFYKEMRKKGYNRCIRDNSIRNGACPCPFYKKKLWSKIKDWFEDLLWRVSYDRR